MRAPTLSRLNVANRGVRQDLSIEAEDADRRLPDAIISFGAGVLGQAAELAAQNEQTGEDRSKSAPLQSTLQQRANNMSQTDVEVGAQTAIAAFQLAQQALMFGSGDQSDSGFTSLKGSNAAAALPGATVKLRQIAAEIGETLPSNVHAAFLDRVPLHLDLAEEDLAQHVLAEKSSAALAVAENLASVERSRAIASYARPEEFEAALDRGLNAYKMTETVSPDQGSAASGAEYEFRLIRDGVREAMEQNDLASAIKLRDRMAARLDDVAIEAVDQDIGAAELTMATSEIAAELISQHGGNFLVANAALSTGIMPAHVQAIEGGIRRAIDQMAKADQATKIELFRQYLSDDKPVLQQVSESLVTDELQHIMRRSKGIDGDGDQTLIDLLYLSRGERHRLDLLDLYSELGDEDFAIVLDLLGADHTGPDGTVSHDAQTRARRAEIDIGVRESVFRTLDGLSISGSSPSVQRPQPSLENHVFQISQDEPQISFMERLFKGDNLLMKEQIGRENPRNLSLAAADPMNESTIGQSIQAAEKGVRENVLEPVDTAAAKLAAKAAIESSLAVQSHTPMARQILSDFLRGEGNDGYSGYRTFGHDSHEVKELLSGANKHIYESAMDNAIKVLRAKGDDPNVIHASTYADDIIVPKAAGLGEFLGVFAGRIDLTDVVGTPTEVRAYEEDGFIYFKMLNDTSLSSFGGERIRGGSNIINPETGAFSTVSQLFIIRVPNPYPEPVAEE